jgi:hypothetical protein
VLAQWPKFDVAEAYRSACLAFAAKPDLVRRNPRDNASSSLRRFERRLPYPCSDVRMRNFCLGGFTDFACCALLGARRLIFQFANSSSFQGGLGPKPISPQHISICIKAALAAAKACDVKLGNYKRIAMAKRKATAHPHVDWPTHRPRTIQLSATAAADDLNHGGITTASDKRWRATSYSHLSAPRPSIDRGLRFLIRGCRLLGVDALCGLPTAAVEDRF